MSRQLPEEAALIERTLTQKRVGYTRSFPMPVQAERNSEAICENHDNNQAKESLNNLMIVQEFDVPITDPSSVFLSHNILATSLPVDNNLIREIVQLLRYCDHAVICLAEKILPLFIVEELKWLVKQDSDARLIVNTQPLADVYKGCSNHIEINPKIDASIVVVWQKDKVDSFVLGNTIYRIEQGEEFIKLLDGKKTKVQTELSDSLFDGAKAVYYCNGDLNERNAWKKIAEQVGSAEFYIIGTVENYNGKETYEYFLVQPFKLLLTECQFPNSIWIKLDKYYRVLRLFGGYLLVEAGREDIREFTSHHYYTPLFLKENLVKNEPRHSYRLQSKGFIKSDIKELKTITKTIEANTIDDYLNTNFDRKFMDGYIEYSDYCQVRYEITLEPPLLTATAKASEKYPSVVSLLNASKEYLDSQTEQFKESYKLYCSVNEKVDYISSWFIKATKLAMDFVITDGRRMKSTLLTDIQRLIIAKQDAGSLIEDCYKATMRKAVGKQYGKKTSRFDKEIEEWRTKIIELQGQRTEDPFNDRKIEKKIKEAEDEIATLEKFKVDLTPQAEVSGDEDLLEIMERYKSIIRGSMRKAEANSDLTIGRVLSNEDDKVQCMEKASIRVVETLMRCQDNIQNLWSELSKLDLPKTGVLYSTAKQALIAINSYESIECARLEAVRYKAKVVVDRINI